MISRTENFAVRPTALIQILRLYEDPNVSPRSLEKIIEQDPALTAKILRVAASSLYGSKSTMSIHRALSVLGMTTLRSISVSLAYQEILNRKTTGAGFDRAIFSQHCRAVAIGSKAIAKLIAPQLMEEMYIAGLLHDIGILCLDRFAPGLMNTAIKKAQAMEISLGEAEREVFRYDHAEVGGLLAEKWKPPTQLTNSIQFHFNPGAETPKSPPTAIVIGAEFLAHKCGYTAMPNIPSHSECELHYNELGLSEEQTEMVCITIQAEVEQVERTMNSDEAAAA